MTDAQWVMHHGDCRERMAALPASSVDAIVTDPPYGLGFMGKEWDHGVPGELFWREALRVAKPGAHLVAFGGTRTFHRLAVAIEDAGWEIRDCLSWLYGSGFPKSLNVSRAIDAAAGAEREVIAERPARGMGFHGTDAAVEETTAPATDEAKRWAGWGTALKPAWEPIILARKPFAQSVAANVLEHGTGALNIDGCRLEGVKPQVTLGPSQFQAQHDGRLSADPTVGRWPPNVVLGHAPGCREIGTKKAVRGIGAGERKTPPANKVYGKGLGGPAVQTVEELVPAWKCAPGCPVALVDEQSGAAGAHAPASGPTLRDGNTSVARGRFNGLPADIAPPFYDDAGGASRFFYCAKASRSEREAGLEDCDKTPPRKEYGQAEESGRTVATPDGGTTVRGKTHIPRTNHHPTVKPVDLMRWLCRLVTPKGGLVLDPFTGSGSTGCAAVLEGFRFVGIEREAEYVEIAGRRIAHAHRATLEAPLSLFWDEVAEWPRK